MWVPRQCVLVIYLLNICSGLWFSPSVASKAELHRGLWHCTEDGGGGWETHGFEAGLKAAP